MTPPCLPCAFLDRDGTIIVDRHYLADPDGVDLLPGSVPGLQALRRLGYRLVLVTNQSGVERGYYTAADVDAVHARLRSRLAAAGIVLDGIYWCPHGPAANCPCRKPEPGLIAQACAEMPIDMGRSVVIGDKGSDVALGRRCGLRTILVTGDTPSADDAGADAVVRNLAEAAAWLEAQAGSLVDSAAPQEPPTGRPASLPNPDPVGRATADEAGRGLVAGEPHPSLGRDHGADHAAPDSPRFARTTVAAQVSRYLGNTSWMLLSRVCHLVAGFLVSLIMARALGPEQFGLLSYALSFVMMFSALGSLGLNDLLVRELVDAGGRGESRRILGSAMVLRLAGTGVMTVLALGCAAFLPRPAGTLGPMVLVCLFYWFLNPAQVFERFFEARVLAKYASWAQLAAIGVSLGTTAALAALQAPLLWFAGVKAVESGVLLAALLLVFRRGGGDWNWCFDRGRAAALLRDGWPLMLTGLFILVYMRIDQVMLGHLLSADDVGVFAVAVRLSEAWYFVPSVIAASVFPAILQARHGDPQRYRQGLGLLYELMTWLGIGVAVPTTLLAPWLIRHLFGIAYAGAAPVLALYIWAGVFVFQGVARGKWLIGAGLQRYAIAFTGGACLLNIVLNAILIPLVGTVGAAWATVAACACQTLVIPALFPPTRPSVVALCRAFVPMGIASFALRHGREALRRTSAEARR